MDLNGLETKRENEHACWIEQEIRSEARSVSESLSGRGGQDSDLTLHTASVADAE